MIETAESYKEVYKYAKRYEYYGGGDDAVDTGAEMTTSDSMTEAADGASEDTKASSASIRIQMCARRAWTKGM